MSELAIILIIGFGLLLIWLEIFFIPGTTVFGFIGGGVMVVGVILAYTQVGPGFGNLMLGISSVLGIASIVVGFKVVTSGKVSMNEIIAGKVNVLDQTLAKVGDTGKTLSILRPNGKAIINGHKMEVYSTGSWIERDENIVVTKVTSDKIYVKPQKS